MSHILILGLALVCCIVSFALGLCVAWLASLRFDRLQEEKELEALLNIHAEDAL